MKACADTWGGMTCTRPLGHAGMHIDETYAATRSVETMPSIIAELEAQLAAAHRALAACREVAAKRAGRT